MSSWHLPNNCFVYPTKQLRSVKMRWDEIVRFVDIGGIDDHHCLNSLFIEWFTDILNFEILWNCFLYLHVYTDQNIEATSSVQNCYSGYWYIHVLLMEIVRIPF